MAQKKKKFYAVAVGNSPGIYTEWYGDNGAGIEGSGEYTQYSVQPAEEGTYQNVSKTKGSYKLP